jgi:L-aspartate oxidase
MTIDGSFDALVVGSGVAGCTTALDLVERGVGRVGLVTKGDLGASTTDWAQGGIAAALNAEDDSIELHFEDTLAAGGGLCDIDATRVLVGDGPDAIRDLVGRGAVLDRDERGELARSREGGHSVPRVVHAGGMATGAEVIRALVSAIAQSRIVVVDQARLSGLLVEDGRCAGIRWRGADGERRELEARATVLATGGTGQLYALTTNPPGATGDGIAVAIRAGIPVCDLEFVQFHPTALAIDRRPRPLLSEGLRGYGALLVGAHGERFVDELAPRDVVSRAIVRQMSDEGSGHVYLDARPITRFAQRFPTLAAILSDAGLDPSSDLLPVAPAAHYICGGVITDLAGHSALGGLYAVGETACTGAEGANRLASNSLLEGLVFGRRAAEAIAAHNDDPEPSGAMCGILAPEKSAIPILTVPRAVGATEVADARCDMDLAGARAELQEAMMRDAGVVRDEKGLVSLGERIGLAAHASAARETPAEDALANLALVASSLASAALARDETRGAHTRADWPMRDDEHFRVRIVVTGLAGGGRDA